MQFLKATLRTLVYEADDWILLSFGAIFGLQDLVCCQIGQIYHEIEETEGEYSIRNIFTKVYTLSNQKNYT